MEKLIRRKVLISMLFIGLTMMGLFSYRYLAMELYPDAEYPTLNISVTTRTDMDPNYLKNQAAVPIEGVVSGMEGVEEIEDQAFRYDGGSIIQSLTMPSSLKTVGSYVLPANVEKVIVNWPDGVKPEGWDNFWMGSLRDDQIEINSI